MTKEEIIEGNKLIAEFMGMQYREGLFPEPHYNIVENNNLTGRFLQSTLKYNSSWEWLMPVVEKIEDIEWDEFKVFAVESEKQECTIKDYREGQAPICYTEGKDKMESIFMAVVEFIKWYNKENKNP